MYMKEHNLCLEEYIQGIEDGTIPLPGGEGEETEEPEAGEEEEYEPEEETAEDEAA